MKIVYELIDEHVDEIKPHLERALAIVPREYVEIHVKRDGDTPVLSITPRGEYRLINLYIGSGFFAEPKESRDLLLVHEFVHILVSPLHDTFKDVLEAFVSEESQQHILATDRWDQFEERAVCDIAFTFNNLMKERDDAK
jgi:hypothetical protein